jgi:glycosyltransferase involved in cell wall biosynthesis
MPAIKALADVVMTTGRTTALAHPGAVGLAERLVEYVPPVDLDEFTVTVDARALSRAALGVPDSAVLVGSVGNRNPQKGHEYVVEATAIARETQTNLVLRIMGSKSPIHPNYEADLQASISRSGFDSRALDEVPSRLGVSGVLAAFDLFVLGSVPRSEGLPTVILEAMASGLPVVATNVGGVAELVSHGVTGYVVPPRDARAFAEPIRLLASDPALRRALGEAGRERAVALWGIERSVDTHVHAYSLALSHSRSRARHEL